MPKILIITINRATINELYNTKKLYFPEELEFKNYIDKKIYKENSLKYELFAINNKIGSSSTNGHFFSNVKINNKWYVFDDSNVTSETPRFFSSKTIGLFYKRLYNQ